MMKRISHPSWHPWALAAIVLVAAGLSRSFLARAAEPAKRVPWTTSRITGSPEPPAPYLLEPAFPKLTFRNPLLLTRAPGSRRFFVGEQAGRILSFPIDPQASRADLFLDLNTLKSWDPARSQGIQALYGLAFHPKFVDNRFCYVCYVLNGPRPGEELPDGTRVSRFTVTATDPPRVDPASEKVLLTWLGGGHNGGDLHFGNDGFLYVSTGDGAGPSPPDPLSTGQDNSDLLSSILRIDVDREEGGRRYAVPADNPFAGKEGTRPEVYAYGFRNPWRMSFDRPTGDLWVGDVGWELWEMIYRVTKGGNYGWSVMEGPQPVKPEGKRGPTPILPPALALPHTEAASITGGCVYRGRRFKDLHGEYVFGDWVTRKLWAARRDGARLVGHREIARGNQRVTAFGEDADGELYVVDYGEAVRIYRLAANPAAAAKTADYPRTLSATGLFASVQDHRPSPGVVPFEVNVPLWADHATAERLLALPGTSTVQMYDSPRPTDGFFSGDVFFPKDGVLARTVSLEMERGNPASRRRLETQILHFDGAAWQATTYAWNDAQTDAVLVPAAGADRTFTVKDAQAPGGKRQQRWHFASRAECLTCHNPWAGPPLAFTLPQLDRPRAGEPGDQLGFLQRAGLVELVHNPDSGGGRFAPPPRLTPPTDTAASLEARARSYLHGNCSHCHRFGGGGTAQIDLRHTLPVDDLKALETRPVQGTFGIPHAEIVAPGDPYRSVLYYRMAKMGPGRMPHLGSELVDEAAVRLIHDWIRGLPVRQEDRKVLARLRALDEPAVLAWENRQRPGRAARLAEELAREAGRDKPTDADRRAAGARLDAEAAAAAQDRAQERTRTIARLLTTPASGLVLARALGEGDIPASLRPQVLDAALAQPDPAVRDLFERFVPDERRVVRLGSTIKPERLLTLQGDAARGRTLFFQSGGPQCSSCHQVGGQGGKLGPDLSKIGGKLSRSQILESLLEPSRTIDPAYVAQMVETSDGKVATGLIASRSDRELVLRIAGDQEVRIPAAKVERVAPQAKSLMPELLLRDLTAEQAADLLEFLAGLK